jgi:hypothetical protein
MNGAWREIQVDLLIPWKQGTKNAKNFRKVATQLGEEVARDRFFDRTSFWWFVVNLISSAEIRPDVPKLSYLASPLTDFMNFKPPSTRII